MTTIEYCHFIDLILVQNLKKSLMTLTSAYLHFSNNFQILNPLLLGKYYVDFVKNLQAAAQYIETKSHENSAF